MDKTKALQNLLKGKATKKEIELLKQALASGEISISGDVNRSVVIIGSGNKVQLTTEALSLLKPETKTEEPVAGEPPYMGLRYFDTSNADLFYGREVLIREIFARVQQESFLTIVGASGSGKSSAVRAGLIPLWQKENERGVMHVITPTAHPLESLAASLTREIESVTATSTLMDDLMKDTRSLRLFVKKIFRETKLLILVDQFEETFTLCKDTVERKAFIENLLYLADVDSLARVVITLRADFYHHCAEYEALRLMLEKHQAYIGMMTVDELQRAITEPAKNNGWDFQPGLVNLILQDVGAEPGALPLLSHALLETWKRRQGCMLTLKGYADAGGVKKAIAQTAENVYDRLTPAEKTIARGIFLRLTELGEGMQDTRRRVKLDELAQNKQQDLVAKVLKILADARLVTTEQDSAEVAHEALIREWGTLRKWLDEDRESLRSYHQLAESAREWERAHKKETFLIHRGGRLDDIVVLSQRLDFPLNHLEKEYLQSCLSLKEKEMQDLEDRLLEKRENKILQAALVILEAVSSSLSIDDIINSALEALSSNFGNSNVFLLLYNKRNNSLDLSKVPQRQLLSKNNLYGNRSIIGLDEYFPASRIAKVSLQTLKQEIEVTSKNKKNTSYFQQIPGVRAELCITLVGKSEGLVGVLVMQKFDRYFDNNDINLLEIVSRQLGLAIERAKIYDELEFKSTVAAQTSWAADLAHELNNEVGKLIAWAYLIQKNSRENVEILEYARKIEESAINLTSANPSANLTYEKMDVDALIKKTAEKYKRDATIEYRLQAAKTKIFVSTTQFQFVIKHLLNNALRAMANLENKNILIKTRTVGQQHVEIFFQDSGPDFDEEKRSDIFHSRITTRGAGGYGLLLVRQVIEDMGGSIKLLPNQLQKGATFLIQLPIADN